MLQIWLIMKKLYVLIVWLALGFCQSANAQSNAEAIQVDPVLAAQPNLEKGKTMSEDEKISHLINYLRNLAGAVFIRNGKEYSPGKAADHLQSKWDKHKKKVKTAHDFVDKLATKSKTDEAYEIKLSDGQKITCNELLNKELARIEQ
jgi:hypothetical protein